MHSVTISSIAVAAIAALPAVSAHGFVSGIVSGGKWYKGSDPNWFYGSSKPPTAGWYALNQDNGFVAPDAYGTQDIACHIGATPGTQSIPVKAGSSIDLQWNTWPDSHHGPVIDYLAKCSGSCSKVDKKSLSWGKIHQGGLLNDAVVPGKWASDKLLANNITHTVKIPASVAPGNYVLRHEIIALHGAGSTNGAQNYPQCINLKISGSGSGVPSGTPSTKLYKATDPGILVSIYQTLKSYKIPGPALWKGAKKAKRFAA
ncbi:uncharacterized protein LTR77_010550 [Saxophila tyrrhenica]|uniref:Auxiliary Activity family 9 catalytic domain-containing protein n=1 Tax=Saxophila tyrrhenica TaxID=1690608 RepID=A0AAV9NVM3_9PEZI|nr:hypothetical protein LTR77_010550 [Saxophila tyrrhenica]